MTSTITSSIGPTLKGMAVSFSFEVCTQGCVAPGRVDHSSTTTSPFMNAWKAQT